MRGKESIECIRDEKRSLVRERLPYRG